jgi:sterol desaturase/sphingolipid hydroxylase (fatty acid hydroxylase superfamily)
MTTTSWKQFTPFFFYTTAAVCAGIAATLSETRSAGRILLLFLAGVLSWCFIEYGLHRFIFHYEARSEPVRRILYGVHQVHHDHPQAMDDLFASLRFSVPIAATYYLILWALLGSWQATAYVFIGLVAGYFTYEWVHYQAHHGRPRSRLLRYLRRYHLLHHHRTPDLRFGVTTPFVDYLFGTFRPVRERAAD